MYYDAPGQRVAIFEEILEGGEETASYDEYFFYKEVGSDCEVVRSRARYIPPFQRFSLRYNTVTKLCTRRFLNETFRPFGVSPTAMFVNTFVIGTNAVEELGLAVNVWADNFGPNGELIRSNL